MVCCRTGGECCHAGVTGGTIELMVVMTIVVVVVLVAGPFDVVKYMGLCCNVCGTYRIYMVHCSW